VPLTGARIEAGMPVCTVTAAAPTLDALRNALTNESARLLQRIDSYCP
jgi:predicted ATP-grasp superfamily ATP-dependent carboligase